MSWPITMKPTTTQHLIIAILILKLTDLPRSPDILRRAVTLFPRESVGDILTHIGSFVARLAVGNIGRSMPTNKAFFEHNTNMQGNNADNTHN